MMLLSTYLWPWHKNILPLWETWDVLGSHRWVSYKELVETSLCSSVHRSEQDHSWKITTSYDFFLRENMVSFKYFILIPLICLLPLALDSVSGCFWGPTMCQGEVTSYCRPHLLRPWRNLEHYLLTLLILKYSLLVVFSSSTYVLFFFLFIFLNS